MTGPRDRDVLFGLAWAWADLVENMTLAGLSEEAARAVLVATVRDYMRLDIREAADDRVTGLLDAVETLRGVHEGWIDPAEIVPDERVWHDRAALAEDAALSAVEELIETMTEPLWGAA